MAGFSVINRASSASPSLSFLGHHHQEKHQQKTLSSSSASSTSSSVNITQTITPKPCRISLSISIFNKNHQSPITRKTTKISATHQIQKLSSSSSSSSPISQNLAFPIMVNGCTGKMGKAIIEAGVSAGLQVVPVSFGAESGAGQIVQVGANADLYCKVGVPFVMGTTGGDREKLYQTVEDSNVYAVISPQMGKQVVAFVAAMEIMAEHFPGAFAGYSLQVTDKAPLRFTYARRGRRDIPGRGVNW